MKTRQLVSSLLLIMSAAVVYMACKKNSGGGIPGVELITPVTASLSGHVTDKNHVPVSGATVKAGSSLTTTDFNGDFIFNDIKINTPKTAFVKVEKEGFFAGSRTYRTSSGSSDFVAIQLIRKTIAGKFSTTTGASIAVPDNGGNINFPVNGIVNANGNATYTGTVTVAAFFINPAAGDFQQMMPGNLIGMNTLNQQTGLQSYGMMAVELTGEGNEKLQLAPGKPATIVFPVAAGLQSQAPVTIPLWSFNDTTGLWKEEGVATRQGNNYVGTVSHLSFWNCDYPLPLFNFKATITNQKDEPLPYVKVLLKTVNDKVSTSGYGYTNSMGIINGNLPANKSLQLIVYNACDEIIYTRDIGPFTAPADLGTLVIVIPAESLLRFTGTVINCAGTPVTSGHVDISLENRYYSASVKNGSFSLSVARCNKNLTTASIKVFDDLTLVQSSTMQVSITDTIVKLGTLKACGTSTSEYLTYKLNGVTNVFTSPTDSLSVYLNQSSVYDISFNRMFPWGNRDEINFVFAPPRTTTTPVLDLTVEVNNFYYTFKPAADITITEYGAVGEYVAGNFTANLVRNGASTLYSITVNFRFKRK